MKTFKTVLMFALCGMLAGCACGHSHRANHASRLHESHGGNSTESYTKQFRMTANVDGSGRIFFTPDRVRYEHFHWKRPTDVTIDGKPWTNLDETPADWAELSSGLNLSKARVVSREGRDTIALELTPEGFTLYLCDSPGGAAPYEITIAIPRR